MALRSQKTIGCLSLILFLSAAAGAQPRWSADATHDHWRGKGRGAISITAQGISFVEPQGKHRWTWPDDEIQELRVAPGEITVVTYVDRSWIRLGADRSYRFAVPDSSVNELPGILRGRLQTRLVVALAQPADPPLWEVPAKRLGAIRGAHGRLIVSETRIVFDATDKSGSRTWTYDDIENISTSGPYQLTVFTYERDRSQYGSIRQFAFQLKRPIDERRYDDLWLALHQRKGLKIP